MRIRLSLILILLFVFPGFGQEDTVKAVALGQIVKITAQIAEPNAVSQIVNISVNGKTVKKFSAPKVTLPEIVGTFSGFEGDFILYRTDLGLDACAGGSLYVIKFGRDPDVDKASGVYVSPVLTTCLGEYPVFSIAYNGKGHSVLTIAGHSINLDSLAEWTENKALSNGRKRSSFDAKNL